MSKNLLYYFGNLKETKLHNNIDSKYKDKDKDNSSGDNQHGSNQTNCIIESVIQEDKLEAFTDGSAINNGKKHVKSGVGVYFPDDTIDNISFNCNNFFKTHPSFSSLKPSNNVAELLAIFIALKILIPKATRASPEQIIIIYSDSEYSINCITKWSLNWKKNGWKKKNKDHIKNIELIKPLSELNSKFRIKFVHINSHMPEPFPKYSPKWMIWNGNDIADKLAQKGAML